jgi:integrase
MGVKTRERDGIWWVFATHKNRRKAKKVGQKKAASKLRKELEAVLQLQGWDGLLQHLGEGPEDTIETYGKMYLASPLNNRWAPATRAAYEIAFNNYIVPAVGKKRLTETKRGDVIGLIESLVKSDSSSGWINTVIVTLSGIFTRALDAEIVTVNPCRELGHYKRQGRKQGKPSPLTEEEAKQTLEAARADRYPVAYEWILLALTSGVRPGEQAGLNWGDVDFEACTLQVERTYSRSKLGKPKNGKSRVVDIPPQTVAALKALRKRLGIIPHPKTPLFQSQRGGRISPDTIRKFVARCAPKKTRAHDLRHTYATLRLQAGDNIFDVSGQLGHSNCEFTARVYTHWIPNQRKQEIEALGLRLVAEV